MDMSRACPADLRTAGERHLLLSPLSMGSFSFLSPLSLSLSLSLPLSLSFQGPSQQQAVCHFKVWRKEKAALAAYVRGNCLHGERASVDPRFPPNLLFKVSGAGFHGRERERGRQKEEKEGERSWKENEWSRRKLGERDS